MDIYSDLTYHILLYFECIIYHVVKCGKLMWWIMWRGKVKMLIELLAMYGGV